MGCDVHVVVEHQFDNGQWVAVWCSDFAPDTADDLLNELDRRNYRRFGALAGVRGDGPAPKGIPADASQLSRIMSDDSDLHSATWWPLADVVRIYNEPRYQGELPGSFTSQSFCGHAWGDGELERYRAVFFFDN